MSNELSQKCKCAEDDSTRMSNDEEPQVTEYSVTNPKRLIMTPQTATVAKTLTDMPDDVLHLIADMLDLDDRNVLSETCRKLNTFFSKPRFINDAWLKIKKRDYSSAEKYLLSTSRNYHRLIWNESVPFVVIQHLSPNVTLTLST